VHLFSNALPMSRLLFAATCSLRSGLGFRSSGPDGIEIQLQFLSRLDSHLLLWIETYEEEGRFRRLADIRENAVQETKSGYTAVLSKKAVTTKSPFRDKLKNK